jgi:hypothetical protein
MERPFPGYDCITYFCFICYMVIKMKKYISTGLLLILFSMTAQAQDNMYSKENLEKASAEELNQYLIQAQKLKKTGGTVTIVGSSTMLVGGVLIAINRETAFYVGSITFLGGLVINAFGIPTLAKGSSRVKKVSKAWNSRSNPVQMALVPCSLYNYQTHNMLPGLLLRIRF